jgi:hypothetical protein
MADPLSQRDQALLRAVSRTIREQDEKLFRAVDERLKALEARTLADSYAGTHDSERSYQRGQLCSYAGSLWLCVHESDAGDKPGRSPNFRMIIKGASR